MYERGSEWRKWDLHVHTASSYDAKYRGSDADTLLVKAWQEKGFAAVAVTDHSLIDIERIQNLRKLDNSITIFPGFEMRTDKGAPNIHVIGIFPETADLETLKNDFDAILIRQNIKEGETNDTIVRDFSVITQFVKSHNGILTIHAGNRTNGIDKEITNALDVGQAIKKDIADSIDIFEIGRAEDVKSYHDHVFQYINEKPLIICSDNHDPRNYQLKEYLWIKANPTFQGLIQSLLQPKERVYIGTVPAKLDMVLKNKSAYLKNVSVKRIEKPQNIHENWFDFSLELNHSLVTIIGNKGSGKSALSDIIGHLCNSNNMDAASFLNIERFRKLPEKKSDDYKGKIEWLDGKTEADVSLSMVNRQTSLEQAQYLPQKYIESVCNDLSNEFQNEIDKVIFSYVDTAEKGDAINLNELIDNRSKPIQISITDLKNQLENCNKEIIRLEDRKTTAYKSTVIANLDKRKDDLARHDRNKPQEVIRAQKEQDAQYEKELSDIKAEITALEAEQNRAREDLRLINARIDQNREIAAAVSQINKRVIEVNKQIASYFSENEELASTTLIVVQAPSDVIEKDFQSLSQKQENLQSVLGLKESSNVDSVIARIEKANSKLNAIIASADSAEKAFQKYLLDAKEWKASRDRIVGDASIDGSVAYYEKELVFINDGLETAYSLKKQERKDLIYKVFDQKQLIADVYKELYRPVERELQPLLEHSNDKIEFDISIILRDKDIGTKLLSYVNQQMVGVFKGKSDAAVTMNEFIQSTDFNDKESLANFINNVLTCISEDMDRSNQKVKDKLGFYNMLSSLDYIKAEYTLKLGKQPLNMLSPGERGIVLLVFYLALSKNDLPLIIDQPEDNLDNQSVFSRLVPCIKAAKSKRQVIIVTHNPNIAIACDAEQIICCTIDKTNNHITYKSGSIEDSEIRKVVVDILEGTMPAFELRKDKYTYELYRHS